MNNSKAQAYRLYLKSPEWEEKRRGAFERAGGRCQLCNSERYLAVHHRTYDRVGRERPEDLTVLCAGCHYRFHHPASVKQPVSRAAARRAIDRQILAAVSEREVVTYDYVRSQVRAPRAQIWARTNRLLKRHAIEWCRGGKMLCLGGKRAVV